MPWLEEPWCTLGTRKSDSEGYIAGSAKTAILQAAWLAALPSGLDARSRHKFSRGSKKRFTLNKGFKNLSCFIYDKEE